MTVSDEYKHKKRGFSFTPLFDEYLTHMKNKGAKISRLIEDTMKKDKSYKIFLKERNEKN